MRKRRFKSVMVFIAISMTLSLVGQTEDRVFLEKDGFIDIEMEYTTSDLDLWVHKTNIEDFRGSGHLEFTGNGKNGGPATSPLEFKFKITNPGLYMLLIRAHKRLDGEEADKHNDGWVRMEGDFDESPHVGDEDGTDARMEFLVKNTKFFGGDAKGWGWAQRLDLPQHGGKRKAVYLLKEGETYTFTISGRSSNWNVDRIVFVNRNMHSVNDGKDESRPPSEIVGNELVLNANDLKSQVKAFPNPATDYLRLTELSDQTKVEIWTLQGQQVFSTSIGSNPEMTVNLEGLNQGLFVLQLTSKQGQTQNIRFAKK